MIRPLAVTAAVVLLAAPAAVPQQCPNAATAGLTLPAGFCAAIVSDSLGPVRHMAALPNGDLAAAVRGPQGGVRILRDTTGDGVFDVVRAFSPGAGGTGIAFHQNALYFATDSVVYRWAWRPGQLEPSGPPDTIVRGLTSRRQHAAKGIAIGTDGMLYVNIGAPSNACQVDDRTAASPGQDPCPLLEISGGIWRFDPRRTGQTQQDGQRYATGLRNSMALAVQPGTGGGALYAAQHGRDLLAGNWSTLYTNEQSAELPAEEIFKVEQGKDYGWPYCYYDQIQKQKVLAPEYGGDGKTVGRCASAAQPVIAFPGHWAPNGMAFYSGTQFPEKYRGGLFIAFHGSWNRAPLPQAGYKVVFVPFARGDVGGEPEVFADGFAGADVSPQGAKHRPTGLAVGSDGSLYVSDDKGGRIFRITVRSE